MQVTCQTVDGKIAQTDILEAELKVNIEAAMPERGGSVSMVAPLLTALSETMAGGCLRLPDPSSSTPAPGGAGSGTRCRGSAARPGGAL